VNQKSGMVNGVFLGYLRKKPDECHLTKDFLLQGPSAAPIHRLDEFFNAAGRMTVGPKDLVFREKTSTLIGSDGKPVVGW
jgi:hypothetical protein